MDKYEITEIFNYLIKGTPVNIERLINLVAFYLTEINYKNSDKIINLIQQMPDLIEQALPKIIEYFENKYTICSLMYNNKILMYYVTS